MLCCLRVFFVAVSCVVVVTLGAPITEISISSEQQTTSETPTDKSVHYEEFADVSTGYKEDEAVKISLFDVDQKEQVDEQISIFESGGPDTTKLEVESIPSQIFSLYDNSQTKTMIAKNPLPIVDTIEEKDKYGNSGDKFDGISRAIVNGYEAFANFLNGIIETPKAVGRSISKGITQKLDQIGAKIVGLA